MISIIIPSYNEEENIAAAKKAVFEALGGEEAEIIFVDDGSRDGTWKAICAEAEEGRVRGIRFSRNFGKEAAIRAGLEHSFGDAAAVMDCDLQHPPEVLCEMIKEWRSGAKVVLGKKSSRGKEARSYGLMSKIFNKMMSSATGADMSDASDFILLDRKAVDAVLSYGEEGSFFRALARTVGFETAEVRYSVAARERGEGKWTFKKLVVYAVGNFAAFSALPLYISFIVGGLASIVGLVLLILSLCGAGIGGFENGVCALMILSGIILMALGVIGFYLAKIYEEVKRRPKYIVSDDTLTERKSK